MTRTWFLQSKTCKIHIGYRGHKNGGQLVRQCCVWRRGFSIYCATASSVLAPNRNDIEIIATVLRNAAANLWQKCGQIAIARVAAEAKSIGNNATRTAAEAAGAVAGGTKITTSSSASGTHKQLYDDLSRIPMWVSSTVQSAGSPRMQHAVYMCVPLCLGKPAPATNNLKLISNERICCHIINELQQKRLPHCQSMGFPWL